jgi:hypothetical protein
LRADRMINDSAGAVKEFYRFGYDGRENAGRRPRGGTQISG